MDDFMIVMAHDNSIIEDSLDHCEPATILAVDLRDNSVKEHDMDDFYHHEGYSFTKYKNNQIIKFGGKKDRNVLKEIICIKIRSLRRIF